MSKPFAIYDYILGAPRVCTVPADVSEALSMVNREELDTLEGLVITPEPFTQSRWQLAGDGTIDISTWPDTGSLTAFVLLYMEEGATLSIMGAAVPEGNEVVEAGRYGLFFSKENGMGWMTTVTTN